MMKKNLQWILFLTACFVLVFGLPLIAAQEPGDQEPEEEDKAEAGDSGAATPPVGELSQGQPEEEVLLEKPENSPSTEPGEERAPAAEDLPVAEPEKKKPLLPIFDGERLHYEFGWNGIAAAEGKISIDVVQYNSKSCYHIVIDLRTRSHIDLIWKVRDRIEAYTEVGTLKSQYYSFRQREGRYNHDTDIIFDHTRKVATSIRRYKGKVKKKSVYFDELYDPVSALLVMRSASIEKGQTKQIMTFEGKRVHTIRYRAEDTQTIRTPFGKMKTLKIFPEIIKTDPPMKKKKKNEVNKAAKVNRLHYWIGLGETALIYRIESDVTVGSIYAKLLKE